jgi:hypothetical protein
MRGTQIIRDIMRLSSQTAGVLMTGGRVGRRSWWRNRPEEAFPPTGFHFHR